MRCRRFLETSPSVLKKIRRKSLGCDELFFRRVMFFAAGGDAYRAGLHRRPRHRAVAAADVLEGNAFRIRQVDVDGGAGRMRVLRQLRAGVVVHAHDADVGVLEGDLVASRNGLRGILGGRTGRHRRQQRHRYQ
jgi:hypothetical protein